MKCSIVSNVVQLPHPTMYKKGCYKIPEYFHKSYEDQDLPIQLHGVTNAQYSRRE